MVKAPGLRLAILAVWILGCAFAFVVPGPSSLKLGTRIQFRNQNSVVSKIALQPRPRSAVTTFSMTLDNKDGKSGKSEKDFDQQDNEWKVAIEEAEKLLTAARAQKEVVKKEFIDFEAEQQAPLAAFRAELKVAEEKKATWGWFPFVDFDTEIRTAQAKIDGVLAAIEDFRTKTIVKIADAEADINAAQAKREDGFAKKFTALKERRAYRDGIAAELLPAAQSALRQAEVAYNGNKTDVAKQILADAQETFDILGIYPDSKASAMSLPGRLYDLQKCIVSGAPYRSGALSGTQYIVLGQSLDAGNFQYPSSYVPPAGSGSSGEGGFDVASADTSSLAAGAVGLVALLLIFLAPTTKNDVPPPPVATYQAPAPAPAKDLKALMEKQESTIQAVEQTEKEQEELAEAKLKAQEAEAAEKRKAEDERIAKERAAENARAEAKLKEQESAKQAAEERARQEEARRLEDARIAEERAREDARIVAEKEAAIQKAKAEAEARRLEARESYQRAKREAEAQEIARAEASAEAARLEEVRRQEEKARLAQEEKARAETARKEAESRRAEVKASYQRAKEEASKKAAAAPAIPATPSLSLDGTTKQALGGVAVVSLLAAFLSGAARGNAAAGISNTKRTPTAGTGSTSTRPLGTSRVGSPLGTQRTVGMPAAAMRGSTTAPSTSLNTDRVKAEIARNPTQALAKFEREEKAARAAWEKASARVDKAEALKILRLSERNTMLARDALQTQKK